jgi:hypothetical protein
MVERRCRYCHQGFQPSKYQPSQAVCSSPDCQRQRRTDYHRNKVAADPEYAESRMVRILRVRDIERAGANPVVSTYGSSLAAFHIRMAQTLRCRPITIERKLWQTGEPEKKDRQLPSSMPEGGDLSPAIQLLLNAFWFDPLGAASPEVEVPVL